MDLFGHLQCKQQKFGAKPPMKKTTSKCDQGHNSHHSKNKNYIILNKPSYSIGASAHADTCDFDHVFSLKRCRRAVTKLFHFILPLHFFVRLKTDLRSFNSKNVHNMSHGCRNGTSNEVRVPKSSAMKFTKNYAGGELL